MSSVCYRKHYSYQQKRSTSTTAVVVNRGRLSAGDSGSVWLAVGVGGATATTPARPAPRTAGPTRAARAAGALRAPSAATGRPLELPPFRRRRPRHRQVRLGEQRERDVPVPAGPAPHLVVIEPHLALRALEAFLDRPPLPGDPHHLRQRRVRWTEAHVVRPVGRIGAACAALRASSPNRAPAAAEWG